MQYTLIDLCHLNNKTFIHYTFYNDIAFIVKIMIFIMLNKVGLRFYCEGLIIAE